MDKVFAFHRQHVFYFQCVRSGKADMQIIDIQREWLCTLAEVQIMQEHMLHLPVGSCFPVFDFVQVLSADMQFSCQPALGISAGIPFCLQCFDKFRIIHVHSSNQKEDVVDEVTVEIFKGMRQYGVSKEHRPNPIVEMGLFMDTRGIPITMCLHPGNTSEQLTAVPLEKEVMKMLPDTKFIYCADAGLGSYNIRKFNSMGGRAFIVTQSIKKLSDVLKQAVFNDYDYRLLSDDTPVTISGMKSFDLYDRKNLELYNDSAYKVLEADKTLDLGLYEDVTLKNGRTVRGKAKGILKQRIIVTFSRKAMEYQRAVRNRQIERARKMINLKDPEEIKKGPNDVKRFLKRVAKTKSGETATIEHILDEEKIAEEEKYDGYNAVATNLSEPAKEILAVSNKRYQIEDCFRIMKTNFDGRPVNHRLRERIKAHFLICYTALLVYRLLEIKLDDQGTHIVFDLIV